MFDSPLLAESAAAKRLGCSVALLRKWRSVGQGPTYLKIGRLVRYSDADLSAFLDAHRVVTGGGR